MQTPSEIKSELLIPTNDCPNPELSLVVPALNEKITIGRFIEWCHEGLKKAGIPGEILIIDSSTDETPRIALEKGARVLRTPKRGLGRAYIDALPHVRGKYVIMGDVDCTYDFRELKPFVEEFHKGKEFIMGTRIKGDMEPDSMPMLHRYFGTPLTTWILNFMYGCNFSDIHCGMRGITRDAYVRLNMQAQTWEYASEMIIKSVRMGFRTAEVPVKFYKDMEGRASHLKRMGWVGPWIAGWQTLRIFFEFKPDFFLRIPGYVLAVFGLLLTFGLSFGSVTLGKVELSMHTQFLGLFLLALGTSFLNIDALTTLHLGFEKGRISRLKRFYKYDKIVPYCWTVTTIGVVLCLWSVVQWVQADFKLFSVSHGFIAGLGLTLMGVQLFLKSVTILLFTRASHPELVEAELRKHRSGGGMVSATIAGV